MPESIIVTGAAGFIGRNTVAALNARGLDDLLLVDHLGADGKWGNLRGLCFEDLISPQAFLDRVRADRAPQAQTLIHLGACSSTTEKDADFLLENNYRYTRELCQWCLRRGVRYVYASSGATYGDGSRSFSDADDATPALRPLNMYGLSKHLFDLWALRHRLFDRIAGLKYFNVYGPHEDHKGDMRSVVHRCYHQVRQRGYVELFKSYRPDYRDGEQQRDFVYVADAVDVTLWLALDPKGRNAGGLFNCGTGQARTWLDLARAVFTAMNRQPDIRFIDMPESLRDKYQYFTQADMAKLRRAGYDRPFTSLEAGVADYVNTHLAVV